MAVDTARSPARTAAAPNGVTGPSGISAVVIGGGPGGMMAAEVMAKAGVAVTLYEQMPSLGRKLLLAGRSGLNLTHSEAVDTLIGRYGPAATRLRPAIEVFDNDALIAWAAELGVPTFVGSSGRVFPQAFKAADLLRAWLDRLTTLGIDIRTKHRWAGWADDAQTDSADQPQTVRIIDPTGDEQVVQCDVVVLALGGASWPSTGSDGKWSELLSAMGIATTPFLPSNCGVVIDWSAVFRDRFEGHPLKNLVLRVGVDSCRGEAVITESGLESGAIYAVGAAIRSAIERDGTAQLAFDLQPDLAGDVIAERLAKQPRSVPLTKRLERAASLQPAAVGLLRESVSNVLPAHPAELAHLVKNVTFAVSDMDALDRAISTAGGVRFDELDDRFMLRSFPGVFAVGEMLDWDAPTGGYLLQATFSTAVAAANGALAWLAEQRE